MLKKIIFTFISIFVVQKLSAQEVKFKIQGIVNQTDSASYAYLTTISQRRPVSSDKIFVKAPIIDGKFAFEGSMDLEGRKYQYACIILDKRGNITKDEVISRFRNLIWVTGQTRNIRIIALENLTLSADSYGEMLKARIVKDGKLTRQLDEEEQAVEAGNRQLVEFIKKYPDSYVAFDAVETSTSIMDKDNYDRLSNMWGSPKELFDALSPRLKSSKEGLQLKRKIALKAY